METSTQPAPAGKTRVVVVGGGFAGLNVAKGLAGVSGVEVVLLDRRNHHLFQPLLYQVAMAGLSPAEIATPIRSIFRRARNVQVLMAEVRGVLPREHRVVTDAGEIPYDFLVLACGAEHSYFGHDDWERFAPGLKTLEQATEIRRRVLTAFERAEVEGSQGGAPSPWLTFAIVGGGPTGVELAGTLGEIARFTLSRDFRNIDPGSARVILIEAGPRLLPAFHEELGEKARRDLESLGVQVWTGCMVKAIDGESVLLSRAGSSDEERLPAKSVIWAAGVKPAPLNAALHAALDVPLDRQGRVIVGADLTLPGFDDVFLLGDQAACRETPEGPALPGLAPVAMQQGRWAARAIRARLRGRRVEPFRYIDKGQMATIGRKRAVVEFGRLRFSGLLAWWLWLVIHIYYLIGFKNRFFVIWEWAYSYLTYHRGARLITRRDWESKP